MTTARLLLACAGATAAAAGPLPTVTVADTAEEARSAPVPLAAWSPDVAAARAFIRTRPGTVGFHLADPTTGRTWSLRASAPVPGASLLKTLLLATSLRQGSVRDRALTSGERARLGPMIRRSANAPASALVLELGAGAIGRTGRAAGMSPVRLRRPWGATTTTPRAQDAPFLALPALLPPRHRAYGMGLLRTVTPSQRWGIGAVRLPGWTVAFKGGWGSGTGRVDHQTALLERGDERLALAITTVGNGSHERGKATLRGVAHRLLRGPAETSPGA